MGNTKAPVVDHRKEQTAMFVFIFLVSFVLFGVWSYVWNRLVVPLSPSPWLHNFLLTLFVLSYLMQLVRWIFHRKTDHLPSVLLTAYFLMGFMAHLFFGTLLKDFILLVLQFIPVVSETAKTPALHHNLIYGTFIVCAAGNLWGILTAVRGPAIREIDIPVKGWPKSQDGFKIAQISDLHVGPIIQKPYVENVVRLTNKLSADMIAITGDLGDGDSSQLKEDLEPLRGLKSKHGSYYVVGNHEYYWNVEHWVESVTALGIRHLFNEGVRITLDEKSIWVAGVPDISGSRIRPDHVSDPFLAIQGAQQDFKVLLAHQPKSCYAAEEAGFDLMLCGHTHWGQFFPLTLLVGFFNPYHKLLNIHGNLQVYVNAGTGYWGPPLRLGVPSEITLLRLRSV